MRRLSLLAAFLLCFSLIPVSAQRGGARGGFAGHGGFGGHGIGMGRPSGGHAFGGSHFGGGTFFGGDPFFHQSFKFSGGLFHGRGFHHCWRCGAGFGFPWYASFGYGYYDPFLWGDWNSSYNSDWQQEQQAQLANQMNALNIREQELRQREDELRAREEQEAYARQPQARNETPVQPVPPTVLVFRDQHQQEITNYAISGKTLWVLSDHVLTKKIPLTDLDLTATAKLNDERGVEFQVPK